MTSKQAPEFIDIDEWVDQCLSKSQVDNGFQVIYSKHTTAAVKIPINITENEPPLPAGMQQFLEKISPRIGDHKHNNLQFRTVNLTPDESPNGHAHLQHPLLGSRETMSVMDRVMLFGQYQSVFFIEWDRELDCRRSREVTVQIVGE